METALLNIPRRLLRLACALLKVSPDDQLDGRATQVPRKFLVSCGLLTALLWPFVGLAAAAHAAPGITIILMIGCEVLFSSVTRTDQDSRSWFFRVLQFNVIVVLVTPLAVYDSVLALYTPPGVTGFEALKRSAWLYVFVPILLKMALFCIRCMRRQQTQDSDHGRSS